MIVMTPVTPEGDSDPRFGRAPRVAVAEVVDGAVVSWAEHQVDWDVLHDEGTHGAHHARVMTFLKENGVEAVVSAEMGPGMARMLDTAKIPVLLASPGDAKASILAAIADPDGTARGGRLVLPLAHRIDGH
ncbi:MAG: dinitrogenase iron-molybdenum cofactor [Actinobacteria bacterium HGW-Actinobacteria-2]|nr:MAG: dinitrogenase iron-molybdenum cofactor [Actinobacteria bacterium HGW-Actinobacteria-2]